MSAVTYACVEIVVGSLMEMEDIAAVAVVRIVAFWRNVCGNPSSAHTHGIIDGANCRRRSTVRAAFKCLFCRWCSSCYGTELTSITSTNAPPSRWTSASISRNGETTLCRACRPHWSTSKQRWLAGCGSGRWRVRLCFVSCCQLLIG